MKDDTPPSGASDGASRFEPADSSGVPTPRALSWNNDHLTSTDLPVVTARSEPTQRGLGIPPPPSSAEFAWDDRSTSITSLSPLSVDAFDKAPSVPPEEPGLARTEPDSTENERITVRAPAPAPASRTKRAMGASLAAAAVLLLSLFVRRATLEPQGVSAAEKKPAAAPAAAPEMAPRAVAPPSTEAPTAAFPAPPLPSPVASAEAAEGTREASPQGSASARVDKRRRAPAGAARPGAFSGRQLSISEPVREAEPPQNRPVLSLPPR